MHRKTVIVMVLALVALPGCTQPRPAASRMGVADLDEQRMSGETMLRVADSSPSDSVNFMITVDVDGTVIGAQLADKDRPKFDPAPALALARTWKFRPQFFEGRPIQAVGEITISYLAPETPPDTTVPFPEIDLDDAEVILQRSAGPFGGIEYGVSIRGDGRVRFSSPDEYYPGKAEREKLFGIQKTIWPGVHESSVSKNDVVNLIEEFRSAHFMGMRHAYIGGYTDGEYYVLTLRIGITSKRVVDYVGAAVGMPAKVRKLQDAVDAVARTDRWLRFDRETATWLKARGLDFKSQDAAEIVRTAMGYSIKEDFVSGGARFILAAMAEGFDPWMRVKTHAGNGRDVLEPIGFEMFQFAASRGQLELFDALDKRGVIARMSKDALNAMFLDAVGCEPGIAQRLVNAGVDPKAHDWRGNALHHFADGVVHCAADGGNSRAAIAQALIALGVPVDARNEDGETPLMNRNDPAVVKVLLQAGANPNATDNEGNRPITSTRDDRVALLLLRAGANPRVRSKDGTLRKIAVDRHWPATLSWLDAHDIL